MVVILGIAVIIMSAITTIPPESSWDKPKIIASKPCKSKKCYTYAVKRITLERRCYERR